MMIEVAILVEYYNVEMSSEMSFLNRSKVLESTLLLSLPIVGN